MANDVTKLKVGAHEVTYNSVVLGFTQDGSTVSIERNIVSVPTDQSGVNTSVREFATGMMVTAKLNLLQVDVDQWLEAMDEGTKFDKPIAASVERAGFGRRPGYVLSDAVLTLHPVALDASDTSCDVTFYKAVAVDNIEYSSTNDASTVIPITFKALWDDSRDDTDKIWTFGDASAT